QVLVELILSGEKLAHPLLGRIERGRQVEIGVVGGIEKRRHQIEVALDAIVDDLFVSGGTGQKIAAPPIVKRAAVSEREPGGSEQPFDAVGLLLLASGDDHPEALEGRPRSEATTWVLAAIGASPICPVSR